MEHNRQENDQRRTKGWEGRTDKRRSHREEDSDWSQLCSERTSQNGHGNEQEGERQRDRNDGGNGGDGIGGGHGDGDGAGAGPSAGAGKGGGNEENKEKAEKRRGRGGRASSEEIVILYLNAQSIVKKIDELCCVADSVKPDLILVTESWCNGDISDAYLGIDGYELLPDLRQDRENTAKGRGGGLLVFARSSVKVLKLDNNIMFQQYCKFMIDDVTVYLVYSSPSSPPEAIVELENLVKSVSRNSILIGDFNMPDIDWEAWTGARKSAGFLDAVEAPCLSKW